MTEELLLNVNPGLVVVDAGGSASVVLQVQNHSQVVDEYDIEVLGVAAAWTTLDPPRVPVFPEGTGSVQISIRPPRASSPEAGTIPVGFRARSTVNPNLTAVEECRVQVKPFVEIAGEIAPKTARGRFSATHKLRVINKGNAPVSVSVRAEVQQGDCQVSVPGGPLVVGTGQRATTKVKVRPSSSRLQGSDEMHSYRLNLEPQGGAPVAVDAMMRQRPILGVPIAMLLAIALVLGGAYAVYGKGPNPIRTALRWTGMVDVVPSSIPTPQAPVTNTSQPAPATSNPVVNKPSPSPSPSPSPTPSTSPVAVPTPPLTFATPIKVFRPVPILLCVPLQSVSLSDTLGQNAHTLTWHGTGTCAPFSGTITAAYRSTFCFFGTCNTSYATYPITGLTGTYVDHPSSLVTVTYTLTLKDGNGNTATATAT